MMKGGPMNRQYFPECNNEECWIRVDWEPPERDTWMSCMLGYKVGSSESDWDTQDFDHDGIPNSIDEDDDNDGVPDDEDCDSDMDGICDDTAENGKYYDWDWINDRSSGTHADLRSDQIFFLEEAEGSNHSLTIRNLKFDSSYWIDIVVLNPHGPQSSWDRHVDRVATPPEPCRDASVPHPDKFVESSDNSLSVHLDGWEEANCRASSFVVEQRQHGEEDWSLVSRSAKPGTNLIVSNLSPATWYQIKVTGKNVGHSPDQETRDTSLEFEIATLAADGSGYSGCVIEKDVKYSGNTLSSQRGVNQETCALLCFKKPACTHWTYNPTFQGGKCWMKSSDSGRAKSTTGSSSGQKACGGRGFSISEVNKAAAAAMADCKPPWTSVETGCYLFQKSNSTWYEARRDCQQKGGYLVEIDSEEEQQEIMYGIRMKGWDRYPGVWIGLTDIFHDGTWVWDHLGRPLNFSNWVEGEPDNVNGLEHCAALNLYVGGAWSDVGCDSVMTEQYSSICEAAGSSMTYTKETGKKWENEFGKTSHMKVLMVHDEDDCGKECTATAPCVAFTFIPGMEICALKAPKDAATLVPAGGDMISGRLDGERPGVQLKALDSTICLPCFPACNVEEGTKYSEHNLFPLGAETQEECAAACLREPECHFWTHNPNVGKCWLKKSDLGRSPSTKGSNSGQKSCGVTEDDLESGRVIENGCDCTSETTEACSIEENTKYSGDNLYTTKGIKVGNMAGCASLCFEDTKCKFWTYNPRVSKCWMKTSDRGRGPSTKGSVSGQKACGAPGALSEEPEQPEQTSGHLTSPNFPASYPNGLHERKTIEVAKGNVIKIHFTDFDLERPDEVDYVDITDGDGSFLGRFGARHYVDEEGSGEGSGDEGPGEMIRISDITSNTETVHVLFHTDSTVTRSGWRLEWSSSLSSSGERELATSGVLTSLNFPERYLDGLDIVQKIRVPEGNTIRIRFTDFDCEPFYDTVTITDKDGTRLGLFDGGENSDDDWRTKEIVSKTDKVMVLFETDSSGRYSGWRLDWGIVGDEESRPKSGVLKSPNYPSRYPSNHDSMQIVEVAEGKHILFEFTNFNTEPEYDWVQVVDPSGTHLTPVEEGGKIWGSSIPPHSPGIRSKSNIIHVKFHTDGSEQRSGWRMEWTETDE